ncbi:hypothetical protein N7530_006024 [Penicillium desertorum]|uniref:Histidine kinase domain-containing protein n=1 Tax=Penicillium desertorum TaxID=1303715 RepID=A0A9X0BRW5_9EURO|nr:hypothetical protein N7530_006024 [Penicillium desertorum]
MSYEIQTPMNGIIGMTLDTDLEPYTREVLNVVHNLGNSLLVIIDDILDISKIEANRMNVEAVLFSLGQTVFKALKTLAIEANEKGLSLTYHINNSVPDYVVGDSFRLRQVILNLIGNAIKFTESGGIQLSITEAKTKVELQADGSMTRRFSGTGLELSISKRLANLIGGGDISLTSATGVGSTFHFTCVVGLTHPSLSDIVKLLSPYNGHRALIIEDRDRYPKGYLNNIRQMLLKVGLEADVMHLVDIVLKPTIPELLEDVIIVPTVKCANTLRASNKFKAVPMVLLCDEVSVNMMSALDLSITSYVTTPCRTIDLVNGILPSLESRPSSISSKQIRPLFVLLVEDNEVNKMEALDEFHRRQYDVVLMDVQMPVMGGLEATAKIRQYEKFHRLPRTQIIALTAHAMFVSLVAVFLFVMMAERGPAFEDGDRVDALYHKNTQDELDARINAFTPAEQKKIMRRVDRRLVPIVGFLYCISLLDRNNLGVANIAGLGGVIGSLVFRLQDAPLYRPGIWACMTANGLILLIVPMMLVKFYRANRRSSRGGKLIQQMEGFMYTY